MHKLVLTICAFPCYKEYGKNLCHKKGDPCPGLSPENTVDVYVAGQWRIAILSEKM